MTSARFPPLMAKKIRFNARELFRLRRHETNAARCERFLADGWADVATLETIATSPLVQAIDRKPPAPSTS
ncbi:hypothetical protein SPRG_10290 [Saprolegnia parasitica CBS 223.65]|uniref:Uncharacterized protein n=1 Tax=Saprolegnia parasitica (strain CBS 223.65) TaxID=695850 RepID=A0A067C0Z8_SAPPC|nr:hypothetical protein SPRG_10290 [Saprolegnia parasitica CBS 223.65]KDO24474.1 hypothetical protein SPRG_10290 [Saprolegnia parasitica CBS 223.65]|eukprot:XP_012204740.1 hypothetical protein SPRG_10290 [Saprolegnia parasitica CBS 223.65]